MRGAGTFAILKRRRYNIDNRRGGLTQKSNAVCDINMLDRLRTLFERHVSNFVDSPEAEHSLEIAGAALLLEISRADHDESPIESATIKASLAKVFHLSDDEITDLLDAAGGAVDEAVSLFDFTAVVNRHFTNAQKVHLLEMLWGVAGADNVIDSFEEYYVRKIADLLHLSHGDYIRTKHKVLGDRAS